MNIPFRIRGLASMIASILSLGFVLLIGGCGGNKKSLGGDANRIQETLNYLASDNLLGRNTGTEGLNLAAGYLEEALESYGVKPYFSSYRDTLANIEDVAFNIVGYIPGKEPLIAEDFLVLGAHYDHIGVVNAVEGDSIANGANDNASGTALLLDLARNLAQSKPDRGILIAFFAAEEKGLLGSVHLAEKLKTSNKNPFAMLNFEMVGVPMQQKDYQLYLTGYEKSNLAELSNRFGGDGLVGLLPQAEEYNLFQRSDNYAFYKVFNIPSHTYSTFDFTNYAYYHQPGDEAGRMDINHMTNLVNRMLPVLVGMANLPSDQLTVN
jgi:hypothetical protein